MTRFGYVMTAYFAAMATIVTAFVTPPIRLLWNASASVPIGLYSVHPIDTPHRGDLLVVKPPERLAAFLAKRHYLPRAVPLLKHVAALPGQRVCRIGDRISVDRRPLGDARRRDSKGRPLPVWQGCRMLGPHELFLMNPDVPDSFDGRYFGPLPVSTVIGRATPLWTEKGPESASPAPTRRAPS
ncbi:MAG: traF [Bradyrhizobium sp.]|nr:traF [Bradyrhizobium sp.]